MTEAHTVTKEVYNIGDILPDGWILMGVSPDREVPFSCEPSATASNAYETWYSGNRRADDLRSKGHMTARLPSIYELKVIWEKVVKAGRNENANFDTHEGLFGGYWSNSPMQNDRQGRICTLGLKTGKIHWDLRESKLSRVRLVRDEPGLKLG